MTHRPVATHVVATAGHVDHGKSTLVKALTGTDPDRLAEERSRGLTIDLGFAETTLPSNRRVAFVDVPGHSRFIRNMLAGVGAVDAAMFVVDAVEGWRAQSEEHLRILELLGHEHGLVVITKRSAVDADHATLLRLELEDHLRGTFLETATIVETDAIDGHGLVELARALDELLATTPRSPDLDRPRLFIDRVFAAKGSGTVVTGTLAGGEVTVDDELLIVPELTRVRVRAIQSLHDRYDQIGPGTRAALNLSGVHHADLARGDALVRPDQWHLTSTVDASLFVLGSLGHTVSRRGAYQGHLGTAAIPVQMRVLGTEALQPGSVGLIRLHLSQEMALLPGDRFVLRESGRGETVGGGEVLDVDPVLTAARARPDRSVDRVIAERGWVDAAELERLTGVGREPNVGSWVVHPAELDQRIERLQQRVTEAGRAGIELATLDERDQAVASLLARTIQRHGRLVDGDLRDEPARHPFLDAVAADRFHPPPPEDFDRQELRELVSRGLLVESDGIFFAPDAIEVAATTVAGLLAEKPDGVTMSEIRQALDTSRKFALAIMAELDSTGRTRRRGDLRVAGPRL